MLLLYEFLQEDPLTSRSKRTGSNGEPYRPYLYTQTHVRFLPTRPQTAVATHPRHTHTHTIKRHVRLITCWRERGASVRGCGESSLTWSVAEPLAEWDAPEAAATPPSGETRRPYCSSPGLHLSHSSTARSTSTQNLHTHTHSYTQSHSRNSLRHTRTSFCNTTEAHIPQFPCNDNTPVFNIETATLVTDLSDSPQKVSQSHFQNREDFTTCLKPSFLVCFFSSFFFAEALRAIWRNIKASCREHWCKRDT